jgi:quinol monooxygenase YgiN
MLVINGTIEFDPAYADTAHAAAVAMQKATRSEDGCHAYAFSACLEDPGRMYIAEKWESQEAVDAHFATEHMAEFGKAIAGIGVKQVQVTKYEIASESKLR